MEGVVLQSVVVVVQFRLGQGGVHWRPGAREKAVDGEGVRGGILKYLLFIDFSAQETSNRVLNLTNLRVRGRS